MQYNMKRHPLPSINLPKEQCSVLELAWMLICKHLGTHIWREDRKASGWRRLALSPRGCGVAVLPSSRNCCLCLVTLEGKWKLWNSREVGKNSNQLQSLCCQMSADIIFIFTGKLMAEENFNFPLAAKCHLRLSHIQLPSQCAPLFCCLNFSMHYCIGLLQPSPGLIPEALVQSATFNYLW